MKPEELKDLMREQYSYICYDEYLAEKFISEHIDLITGKSNDEICWLFADCLMSQDLCEVEE